MSTEKPKTVWTACSSCDRDTRHDILFSAEESEYEYRIDRFYQVVSCRGCETKSFRTVIAHLEEAYQVDEDEWKVPKDILLYPAVLKGHRAVTDMARAPGVVRDIYEQSIQAIKNQANTLAGIGLRATIEATLRSSGAPAAGLSGTPKQKDYSCALGNADFVI